MSEYKKQTDEVHNITLDSKITNMNWRQKIATVGDTVSFFVQTHHVGSGSDIQVKFEDKKGKVKLSTGDEPGKLKGTVSGKVYGDQFMGTIIVPEKAREELKFTVKLNKHGLEMKSKPMIVFPKINVTNLKWGQKEARRGDIVKLSADVENLPDEAEVMIVIYEYDQDGAHDFITKFSCRVKNKKIEAEWEFEYHEDTDEIPTQEEKEKYGKNYNPPEYFFVIDFYGQRFGDEQESGLLEFKDWIEVGLKDGYGAPIKDKKFVIICAGGSKKEGKLDSNGKAKLEDIPPGPYEIDFPEISEFKRE
ncbi:MAG: hypothetical protein JSV50_08335 [Desulfobacteraceae bacterium]|nr:MAG: hypothetical protein JSV50_08335 [Desulfobacteraceae bacterium]